MTFTDKLENAQWNVWNMVYQQEHYQYNVANPELTQWFQEVPTSRKLLPDQTLPINKSGSTLQPSLPSPSSSFHLYRRSELRLRVLFTSRAEESQRAC